MESCHSFSAGYERKENLKGGRHSETNVFIEIFAVCLEILVLTFIGFTAQRGVASNIMLAVYRMSSMLMEADLNTKVEALEADASKQTGQTKGLLHHCLEMEMKQRQDATAHLSCTLPKGHCG